MDTFEFDLHANAEQRHWWFTGRRSIMHELLHAIVKPNEGSMVLDIGCGTGANIASLAQDYLAIGIDASRYAIEHAQRAFPDVDFHCTTDDERISSFVRQASAITIMDVLEHVPDDYQMLSRLLEAAQPGTHFLLTVPANLSLWSKHDEVLGHYRRYSLEALAHLWEGLDVDCRLLSYFNTRLYPIVQLVRRVKRQREAKTTLHETDLKVPIAPLNAILRSVFAGEAGRLCRALEAPAAAYKQGVSLVAVLRRGAGRIEPRGRPDEARPDYYDPVHKRYFASENSDSDHGDSASVRKQGRPNP